MKNQSRSPFFLLALLALAAGVGTAIYRTSSNGFPLQGISTIQTSDEARPIPVGQSSIQDLESRSKRITKSSTNRSDQLKSKIRQLVDENANANRGEVIKTLLLLVDEDPVGALETITTLPDDYGSWVAVELHKMCVDRDPERVSAWLKDFAPTSSKELILASNIFGVLATRDPDMAFQSIAALSSKQRIALLMSGGAAIWAQSDPEAALDSAKKYLTGDELVWASSAMILISAAKDPVRAISLASELSGPARNETLLNIYSRLHRKEGVRAVLGYLQNDDPSVIQQALGNNGLIQEAAKEAPSEAIEILSKIIFTDSSSSLFEDTAKVFGSSSLSNAQDWIATFPDGPGKERLKSAAIQGIASKSPEIAAEAIAQLPMSERTSELKGFARGLGETSNSEFLWRSFPSLNSLEQEHLIADYGSTLSARNPSSSVDFLTSEKLPKEIAMSSSVTQALASAAESAAKQDPSSIVSAFESAPSFQREAMVGGIISGWASVDVEAASAWLDSLPDGGIRDRGIDSLVKEIQATDPSAAAEWRRASGSAPSQ